MASIDSSSRTFSGKSFYHPPAIFAVILLRLANTSKLDGRSRTTEASELLHWRKNTLHWNSILSLAEDLRYHPNNIVHYIFCLISNGINMFPSSTNYSPSRYDSHNEHFEAEKVLGGIQAGKNKTKSEAFGNSMNDRMSWNSRMFQNGPERKRNVVFLGRLCIAMFVRVAATYFEWA